MMHDDQFLLPFLSQQDHNKGLSVVAAVSSDGFRLLLEDVKIRLSTSDFDITVLLPDKDVVTKLIERVCCAFNITSVTRLDHINITISLISRVCACNMLGMARK